MISEAIGLKAAYKVGKCAGTFASRKITGALPQRIRPRRIGDDDPAAFRCQKRREEYALMVRKAYDGPFSTTTSALLQDLDARWASMPGCPVTREEEDAAGIRHFYRTVDDPDFDGLVIAIRGTKLSSIEDLVSDFQHAWEILHTGNRYRACATVVERLINHYTQDMRSNPRDVVLVGHSLGALIAYRISLDHSNVISAPYLFNYPYMNFISLIDRVVPGKTIRDKVRNSTLVKPWDTAKAIGDVAHAALKGKRKELANRYIQYTNLTEWVPQMFNNKNDPISKGNEELYSRHHGRMKDLPRMDQTTLSQMVGLNAEHCTALVPSVDLYINRMSPGNPFKSHSINQWFSSRLPDNSETVYEDVDLRYERIRKANMNDAEVQKQIQQMVHFIRHEAEEKANEIAVSAEEEFNIDKLQLVEAEKNRIRVDYDRKERLAALRKKIEYSTTANAQRIRYLNAQDELLRRMRDAAERHLGTICNQQGPYAKFLEALIIQVDAMPSGVI